MLFCHLDTQGLGSRRDLCAPGDQHQAEEQLPREWFGAEVKGTGSGVTSGAAALLAV